MVKQQLCSHDLAMNMILCNAHTYCCAMGIANILIIVVIVCFLPLVKLAGFHSVFHFKDSKKNIAVSFSKLSLVTRIIKAK